MLQTKKLSILDTFYNKSHGMVQLVMRINHPKRIPEITEKLSQIVLGLHLFTDDSHFYYKHKNIVPVLIPNFDDLEQTARFMYENHTPDFTESLAKIGVNSDTIVLNIAHTCADGVYFLNLVDAISHIDRKIEPFPHLPSTVSENFYRQIHSPDVEQCPYIFTDPDLLRIQVPQHIKPENISKFAKHIRMSIPVSELQIYDKATKRISGLTESLWTTYILSTAAYNDRIDHTGIATCIDMRKYLSNDQKNWSVCNHYSNITPACDIDEKMTVRELGKRMREDFNAKIKKGHHFSFLDSFTPPEGKPIPGIGLELSNIGRFVFSGPIEDVFVKSSVGDKDCDPLISHSSFSVSGNGRNVLNGMFRYKSSKLDDKIAKTIGKSVEFALRNLPLDFSVSKAIDLIQNYQKSIKF